MSNGKVAYLAFKDVFTAIEPKLEKTLFPSKFTAFGRLKLNLQKMEILINYSEKMVTLQAELFSFAKNGALDRFDFDDDSRRGKEWNFATRIVHREVPDGSTSYIIYGKGISKFKHIYSFQEFLE